MDRTPDLPIDAVLPDLLAALAHRSSAVLIAPPGAGKTTAVAPALVSQEWCTGQIILTSPRRVAARAAAERIAAMLGEPVGQRIGYRTRLEGKGGQDARIMIVTEGILVNRLLADQELAGVSAILFDEAHERHLDGDLALALSIEVQSVLRPDLRLCVMSATIDGARFGELLGPETPTITSEGKAWPLGIGWLGAAPEKRLEDAMTSAILTAWREREGDILAFLPGVAEIERTRSAVEARLPGTPVLPLHGQVAPADQRRAIRRDADGQRRIVLATSIAETSLTLEGVSIVVDSGLSRRAEYDRAAGTTRLVTRRSSQASAAQRAGRAARQGPGFAYRLWEEGGHAGRPAYDVPEILEADLAGLVLRLAAWGTADPADLRWLDPPPAPAISAARGQLQGIGALDGAGAITGRGRRIAALPLEPRDAAALLLAARAGEALPVAELIVLSQERGLGGRGEDLTARQTRWHGERGARASAARQLAKGWAKRATSMVPSAGDDSGSPAMHLAASRPAFVAKRRGGSGEDWQSVGGRGFRLDPASSLANAEWLVIMDAQGQARSARITAAVPLSQAEAEAALASHIESRTLLRWNEAAERIEARRERRLGNIVLASGPDPAPDTEQLVDKLLDKAVERLDTLLPPGFLARAGFAGIDELSLSTLAASAGEWLRPLLHGRSDLRLDTGAVAEAALTRLSWSQRQQLDLAAPTHFTSPAGTRHRIDYAAEGAPCVEVRVQALFGAVQHPMIGDKGRLTALLLKLTSPAGRPIQSTRDLPGFWQGSWRDVRKEMKGRYPKHRWPEEPWREPPSLKTKNAFSKGAR